MTMVCWRDDRQPFPNSSPRWFYVFLDNGQEGYVWSPQIANQTPNMPNCSTVNWINVSDWAIGRLGLQQWRSTQADGPRPWSQQDNPNNWWAGYCLGFAANAWTMAGGGMQGPTFSTANQAWSWYAMQGRANQSGSRPPRGALIFWNNSQTGHVAISLGNWQAIGTWQAAPDPIMRYRTSAVTNFSGWVMPSATVPYNTM